MLDRYNAERRLSVLVYFFYKLNWRMLGVAVFLLCVGACTHFSFKYAAVYQALSQGDPESALQALEVTKHRKRDRVLYQLDKALLLSMLGQYHESNDLLESVKLMMQALSATSITENMSAVMINEASRSYAGQPYEQILLYAYKALNYLALDDTDSARVEVLQANVKMREWAAAKDIEGILASAFVRYLSGVVFELHQEWSDALIAYRKAYEILEENGTQTPIYLQRDLLRLTAYQGLDDEHKTLRETFGLESWLSFKQLQDQVQVILVYHQGLVSRMQEQSVFQFAPELNQSVRISVPYYSVSQSYMAYSQLQVGNQQVKTELIEDVDQLARNNLADRMPGLMLRTVARVVVKKMAAKEAGKENSLVGFMTDIAGIVTEVADTRSWSSLPATIQIARLAVPAGEQSLSIPMRENVFAVSAPSHNIRLEAGQIKVISVYNTAH